MERMLQSLVEDGRIPEDTMSEILRHDWQEIRKALGEIQQVSDVSFLNLLRREFDALLQASLYGFPTPPGAHTDYPLRFEVSRHDLRTCRGPSGLAFRVAPVRRLHAVIVQQGYERFVGDIQEVTLVDVGFAHGGQKWYPGVELAGEGLFVRLEPEPRMRLKLSSEASGQWHSCFMRPDPSYNSSLGVFREPISKEELHPIFVWWHTLSHLLLKTLAVDSGYTAASIRERVYIDLQRDPPEGAVILYSSQPGADGTLGGLLAQAARFEQILERSLEMAHACSNDPLCFQQRFDRGQFAGASCYGCVQVSETSCEHRNLWLDRHVILEEGP